jgi:hypothetical protein
MEDYSLILSKPESIRKFIKTKVESKKKWYFENQTRFNGRTWKSWHEKVIEIFYKGNLGIKIPEDGKIVHMSENVLIVDIIGPCPILNSCLKKGNNTVQVCSILYHVQYQVLLSLIDPQLLFTRDYSRLRPRVDHCREIIYYKEKG